MTTARLQERHLADLRSSGLSDETISSSRIESATEAAVRELLGFGVGPGMVIPYPGTKGDWHGEFAQVKPDTPPIWGEKLAKYVSPKDSGNWLYIPPTLDPKVLTDPNIPLYLTEGAKKVLKGNQEGLPTIGVLGVWSWRGKRDGRSVPIPDLDRIVWQRRTVYVVFDSDVATKEPVRWAQFKLAQELRRRGAKVSVILLPAGGNGEKVGLDDYLCRHSVDTFCALPPVAIEHPEKAQQKSGPPARTMSECLQGYFRDLRDPVPRIHLGYSSLSQWHRGLARGEVLVTLARTGVGKTAFAVNVLERTAVKHHLPSLFFSLEMSGEEITERILAMSLAEPAHVIASFARHEGSSVAQRAPEALAPWSTVRVIDTPCRLRDIEAAIAAAPETRLVVIDYLGMIIPARQGSLYEATSELARGLKRIAGAHRVSMIVLSQIGRQGESGGVPVTLNDARDSGAIEEAANYVLGAWRPDLAENAGAPADSQVVDLKIRILKSRSGQSWKTVTLAMDLRTLRITDPGTGDADSIHQGASRIPYKENGS